MSKVINFLESVGSRPLSAADYTAAVAMLGVEEAQEQALLNQDHRALNELLKGRDVMYCLVATPDQEESPARPTEPDEQEDRPDDSPADPKA